MTAFEFLAKALWWVGWWVYIISCNKYKLKQILNGVLWQRDRDSNPGYPCGYNGFRIRPVRPLRHLSTTSRCVCLLTEMLLCKPDYQLKSYQYGLP